MEIVGALSEKSIDALTNSKPRLMSTAMAAEWVGLHKRRLEELRHKGGGPAYVKLGRRCYYVADALDQWIQEQSVRSTAEAKARLHMQSK